MTRKCTGEITRLAATYGWLLDNEEHYRFFHAKYVRGVAFDDLDIGDRVEFTPFIGPRGYRAEDVRRTVGVA